MRTSEQINEIAAALAKAQGAIEGAKKDSLNPHFRSKYADLGAVWDACRDALTKNGIAVIQPVDLRVPPDGSPTALRVTVTRLVHSSGQWMEDGGIPLILSKEDMQGLGSALTYSRRYGLMAMVGIAPEDDDGNAASQQKQPPAVETVAPKGPAKPIPAGAVLLKKTEQHETSAGKKYWLLVLAGGEEIIEWKEQQAIFAEQACQDGTPVVITTSGGQWDGKPVVRTILLADQHAPKKKPTAPTPAELVASDIPF
jgi:hypothetical protein